MSSSQSKTQPQYVEDVFVTVDRSFSHRGFAFGHGTIAGKKVEIYIPQHGCAKRHFGGWEKIPARAQYTPGEARFLTARVRLSDNPFKKPSAVLWECWGDPDDDLDDVDEDDGFDEWWAEHEAHCDGCYYCNPTGFWREE